MSKIKYISLPVSACLLTVSAFAADAQSQSAINNIVNILFPIVSIVGVVVLILALVKFVLALLSDAVESKVQSILAMILAGVLIVTPPLIKGFMTSVGYDDRTGSAYNGYDFLLYTNGSSGDMQGAVVPGYANGLNHPPMISRGPAGCLYSHHDNSFCLRGFESTKAKALDDSGLFEVSYYFNVGTPRDDYSATVSIFRGEKFIFPFSNANMIGCDVYFGSGTQKERISDVEVNVYNDGYTSNGVWRLLPRYGEQSVSTGAVSLTNVSGSVAVAVFPHDKCLEHYRSGFHDLSGNSVFEVTVVFKFQSLS